MDGKIRRADLQRSPRPARGRFTATLMTLRRVTLAAGIASSLACSSQPQSNRACAAADLDCVLSNLTVQQDAGALALQTIERAKLSPTAVPPALWAVGVANDAGLIAGWNGLSWTAYPDPAPASALSAIWTNSASDAWAGGSSDVLLHWNGTTWAVATPSGIPDGGAGDSIVGIWGDSPSDLWAVTALGQVAHFSGSWSAFSQLAPSGTLSALWGASGHDIWAVGSTAEFLGTATAYHYDGGSWSPVNIGGSDAGPIGGFADIWGASASDIWAVTGEGCYGSGNISASTSLFHWNGAAWSKNLSASQIAQSLCDYSTMSLAGTGADDVWLAGYNIGGSLLAHDDGNGWALQPTFTTLLQGGRLFAAGKNDLWMAGQDLRHWDGSSWKTVQGPTGTYLAIGGISSGGPTKGPPAITNQPDPVHLTSTSSVVNEAIQWSDPSGCQPAFCFSVCSADQRCSSSARCSHAIRDGLLVGQAIFQLGCRYGVADGPADYTLEVTPVSSADCQDPLALLASNASGALVGGASAIAETIPASGAGGGSGGGGGGSPVGSWKAAGTSTSGADTTTFVITYTFNADGSESYSDSVHDVYTDGTPSASGHCTAAGNYTTSGNSITITTPNPPPECGGIISPYTTTFAIVGNTLNFGGDSHDYIKQ